MPRSTTSTQAQRRHRRTLPLAGALAAGLCLATAGQADESHAHAGHEHHTHAMHQHGGEAVTAAAAEVRLLDLPLLSPDGVTTSLPKLLAEKPAAIIGFFYSQCDLACPITTKLLQGVMTKLSEAERARTRVLLVTLDPANDTAEVLSQYAARMKVPPDWTLLTGKPADVKEVLLGLGAYATDLASHPPQLLVRAGPDAGFMRLFGLPDAAAVRETLAQR